MKDSAEVFKLRKKKRARTEESAGGSSLDFAISEILKDLTERCVKDKGNLHITGEDICLFIKELSEKARGHSEEEDNSKYSHFSDLKLFLQIEHYYRFHIQNRKYQSFRVELETQNQEDARAALEGRFNDLINFANDPERDKANEANAFNLCSILIQHIYQTLNRAPGKFGGYGECKPVDAGYMKSGYVPLNDYHKSELRTWNRLLQEDGAYSHSIYPYCKFQEMDAHNRIILLIVTRLDVNYVDEKVKEVDKIEPIHMIILKSPHLYNDIGESELKSIEFKLRHAVGYLSYVVLAGRTNESLASMSTEAALVARHWYSTGIEKLFSESEDEHGDNITGMTFSKKIVDEMLCADVEGLETLEVFPFDRCYLFSGSNFRAIEKDSIGSRGNSPMKLTVLEASIKSKRPQDNDRFLSTMERLEKKSDAYKQPDLDTFFDVTKKKIAYRTDCLIDSNGKEWELRIVDSRQESKLERIIENLAEESGDLTENKESINAIIKTVFSGFTGGDDTSLQAYCQQTYQFYDVDGLCLLSDFAVKVKDIPALKKIQDAYFDVFFDREGAEWKRIWSDNPQNIPDLEGFKAWLAEKESKVVFISFDPYQNLSNMDREGNRYLKDSDSFTMIMVADEDIGKNNFDLQTEVLDLREMLLMVIRRKLREVKMMKEVIRGQKKFFETMMSAIMHRFKHYVPEKNQRDEIDHMRKRFEKVLKAEDFSAQYKEFSSSQNIYEYFLIPLINEQLGDKSGKIENGETFKQEFERTCNRYLEKLKSIRKTTDVDVEKLEIKFHETYFPRIQVKLQDDFVKEAVKILINNAVEHAAIYSHRTGAKAEITISFNLSPMLENDFYSFELSIINSSFHIDPQKLYNLNSPVPKQSQRDTFKASSTGIGIFIARTQLQKSIGKGADIRLDNVGTNFVEAKLILPAKKVQQLFGDIEEPGDNGDDTQIIPGYQEYGYILYIEDIPEIQDNSKEALVTLLGDQGKLFACDNRQEALSVIAQALPSIILLDLTILRKPGESGPIIDYAIDVMREVINRNKKTPIVILSHRQVKEVEMLLKDEIDLKDYQFEIKDFDKDVDIKEKTIVIPAHEIKNLLEDEGKGLMKALEKWLRQENMTIEIKGDESREKKPIKEQLKNELPFVKVNFFDKTFDEKLEEYRANNISVYIPNEIFIATAKGGDEEMLFEAICQWFLHPGLQSFYEDDLDIDQRLPLTRNERFRTIFLNIQIADKLKDLVDLKFRYWGLPHNILLSKPGIKIDKKLAWKWKFTAHGVRGTLSNLRHDIKNKVRVDERKEIITQINAVEEQLLFKDENLSSNLKHAFKNKDKSILEMLKSRSDNASLLVKDLFDELNNAFYEQKSSPQVRVFQEMSERLQEFLEM